MATNFNKFEYDLLQAESLDDYFKHLDAGQNLLPIGGIQLGDLPAVKIGTPEATDVREILGDLPIMLRNIKNSYLTVDLMPSGIAYDNTSLNNVLLIKLDIATWFNLLYSTATREDLVTSMAKLAKARDKTEELSEKLTNYENKVTNDVLHDADEQLDNADNSTESTNEALDKLDHDNLADVHLGDKNAKDEEQTKDAAATNSDQDNTPNDDDANSGQDSTSNDDATNSDQDSTSSDDAANSDQDSTSNDDATNSNQDNTSNDDVANSDQDSTSNDQNGASNGTSSDDNKSTSENDVTDNENNAENQANNENDENSSDNATESNNENQGDPQDTKSANNVDGTGTDDLLDSVKNNTDGDNVSSELDALEQENVPYNVTNRSLGTDVQTEKAKQDNKLQQQQVKTASENAKANINSKSQADVPSVKMQTPPVQVTNTTGQDTQTQLLAKMMETLNLVLKRENKKDEEKQEPKAISELTPKERLAKFRSEQDQLIASMIAKQI